MELMEITLRQKDLLEKIVQEYIGSAKPVSSQLLEKKYKFSISPATIRSEMQALTGEDYLFQPHTSAGRIPTDRGYRFFVNELLEKGFFEKGLNLKIENWIEKEIQDPIKFIQSLTKGLAIFSSNLALSYLQNEKILWREGWEEVLLEPEFQERKFISGFALLLKNFEEGLEELKINSGFKFILEKKTLFLKLKISVQ